LDLPLGDAALNLGVVAEYSAINALQNASRLDSAFLSKLLVKHSTGVSVLAAPGKFPQFPATNEAIDKLIAVARQDFENVVIDMGSRLDLMGTSLFKEGATVYLVIQAGIAGLRNSNRLISQYFATGVPKLEIVLNRYEPRSMGVPEDQITKALTRPANWKIPNDYAAVRRMQSTAVPLALEDSPISRLIHQMARSACGLPPAQEKKAGFSLKSLSRSISAKMSAPEETTSFTQLGLTSEQDNNRNSPSAARPEATANIPARIVPPPAPRAQAPIPPPAAQERIDPRDARRDARSGASAPSRQAEAELETRSYKGATYVKGPDGEWHLLQDSAKIMKEEAPAPAARQETPPAPVRQEAPPAAARQEAPEPVEPQERETTAVAWSTPASIPYGTALSTKQLRAMASAPGKFVYTPPVGEVLPAGVHTLTVDFTPTDMVSFTPAQATVQITVTKATPTITWPAPAAIAYGTALSAAQLNATSQIPGTFVYAPAAGEVLEAGNQTLSVTFTPKDTGSYNEARASVPLTVNKAVATITWPAPAPIVYGAALGAAQLRATASVPGTFVYTPAAGAVLPTGTHTLSAAFTPANSASFAADQATVSLTVTKAKPALTWPAPAPIVYGTALSAAQLNATASVAGKFAYIPGIGAVLAAGTHTPSVIFTPADTTNYTAAQAAVSLTVTKAKPAVTWPTPAPVVYGTPLSPAQLNATASVPGKFVYAPAAGEVLAAGTHTLSATFTPTDITDYAAAEATVSLTVTKAKPTVIAWPTPSPIVYGIALSATQLNATATIPGRFVYSPAIGEVLGSGQHTLSVTFVPADPNFPEAQASVPLTVTKATPTISWQTPAGISYGTALSAAQLNAKASVLGTFVYSPAAGEVLAAGTHTLSVTFTPKETTDVATTQASVTLTVAKATPIITWPVPAPIPYGTMLGATQLNATALVPGNFLYTPAAGTVLAAGTQTLSATFTPADATDYTTAQATVSLVVEGLPNLDTLMPAMTDAELERAGAADAKGGAAQSGGSTPNQQNQPETRTYKGATYVKGADGQWYLQKK
ncbi:MAG: hypothetical protein ABSC48_15765, partial [Terracidiphilus sp.]